MDMKTIKFKPLFNAVSRGPPIILKTEVLNSRGEVLYMKDFSVIKCNYSAPFLLIGSSLVKGFKHPLIESWSISGGWPTEIERAIRSISKNEFVAIIILCGGNCLKYHGGRAPLSVEQVIHVVFKQNVTLNQNALISRLRTVF